MSNIFCNSEIAIELDRIIHDDMFKEFLESNLVCQVQYMILRDYVDSGSLPPRIKKIMNNITTSFIKFKYSNNYEDLSDESITFDSSNSSNYEELTDESITFDITKLSSIVKEIYPIVYIEIVDHEQINKVKQLNELNELKRVNETNRLLQDD